LPISRDLERYPHAICTVLTGTVTDAEVLAYYRDPELVPPGDKWLELVDGLGVSGIGLTAEGYQQLALLLARQQERLRGGRVAMVATRDVVYGVFRMWELQREGVGYTVRVFRELEAAREWLFET
jgi:hypothetical protein